MYNIKSKNNSFHHIHFIGIGGIGMSALAIILKQRGVVVSGSDCTIHQKSIINLQALGCNVYHDAETRTLAPSVDTVVYSAAIPPHNNELAQARARKIRLMTRSQLLAELFNEQKGIAIAGAHGKTTTSSLIAHIFMHASLEPTFAIGGHLHNYQTNAHAGSGNFFVAEACENDHTIERVKPWISILTNVDREHLDIYKDLDEIKAAFLCYLNNTKLNGSLILCHDDVNTMSLVCALAEHHKNNVITYGFSKDADITITEFELHPNDSTVVVAQKNRTTNRLEPLGTFTLTIPGKHNVLNALAALAASQKSGISFETFAQACQSFKGIDRRFTFKGTYKGAELFDDYGHHPAEIEQIVQVAYRRAQSLGGRLIILFQPHRYSRTEKLWNDFLKVFTNAEFDTLIITDIYPAFEEPIATISSERLVQELTELLPQKNILYVPEDTTFTHAHTALDTFIQPNDLIFFLGAGKINQLATKLAA